MIKEIATVLNDWLPIIISALSLIISIINNRKSNKQNRKYNEQKQELEIQKEKIHHQERTTDEIFMQLNSRSHLIPYFHLVLDDSKIEKLTRGSSEQMKLVIGLVNIGKESAANIMLYPMGKGLENFFETVSEQQNSYFIHENLNQNYAFPKECVLFSIVKEIPKDNDRKIFNFIKFKIRFRDLLGNLYEQEFKFGYDNCIVNGFNLNSTSGVPYLVKE